MTVVAFATCARRGTEPDVDGGILREELRSRGIEDVWIPWDTPGFPWHETAGCVVKATWDYYLRPAAFTAWATDTARRTPLWNSAADLTVNCHKSYLRGLTEAGVPTVPTSLVHRGTAAAEALRDQPWDDVVIKPAISVGALRTERFTRGSTEAVRFLSEMTATEDALVQPYLPSIASTGEVSLVFLGGELAHAVRKLPPPGTFAAQPHLGALVERCEPTPEMVAVATGALHTADAPLLARVDLVDHDGAPVVMELELIEPALFLDHAPASAAILAKALCARLAGGGRQTDDDCEHS
jgi:hypothetical protein